MINSSLTLPASGVHALAAMVVVDDGRPDARRSASRVRWRPRVGLFRW